MNEEPSLGSLQRQINNLQTEIKRLDGNQARLLKKLEMLDTLKWYNDRIVERLNKLEEGAQLIGTTGRTVPVRAYTEFGTLEYPEDIARARGLLDELSDSTSITEPDRELLRKVVAFAEQMLGGFVAEQEKERREVNYHGKAAK